jgi:hypothetical protein
MFKFQRQWLSSFEVDTEITREQSVLSVVSGSTGTGGHASMFLEYYPLQAGYPETRCIELGTRGGACDVWAVVKSTPVQIIMDGVITCTHLPKTNADNSPKEGTNGAADSHHKSYVLTKAETIRLLMAVDKFADKARGGRYPYLKAGGALGYVFSKAGHRAVNCADFVIKVLNDAGIANVGYRLWDTPLRIATT